jgi:hypothetical protein
LERDEMERKVKHAPEGFYRGNVGVAIQRRVAVLFGVVLPLLIVRRHSVCVAIDDPRQWPSAHWMTLNRRTRGKNGSVGIEVKEKLLLGGRLNYSADYTSFNIPAINLVNRTERCYQ